jgi:thymidylate kinase
MFIFEGADHVGKDTCIKLFQKIWKKAYDTDIPMFDGFNVHDKTLTEDIATHIKEPKEWQKAIGYEVVNFCKQTKVDVIINRFNWSEVVYGNVLRDGADLKWYFDVMEKELLGNAVIIYVTADTEDILARIAASGRQKSQAVIDNIDKLKAAYEVLIKNTKLPGGVVDTSQPMEDVIKDLFNIMKETEHI